MRDVVITSRFPCPSHARVHGRLELSNVLIERRYLLPGSNAIVRARPERIATVDAVCSAVLLDSADGRAPELVVSVVTTDAPKVRGGRFPHGRSAATRRCRADLTAAVDEPRSYGVACAAARSRSADNTVISARSFVARASYSANQPAARSTSVWRVSMVSRLRNRDHGLVKPSSRCCALSTRERESSRRFSVSVRSPLFVDKVPSTRSTPCVSSYRFLPRVDCSSHRSRSACGDNTSPRVAEHALDLFLDVERGTVDPIATQPPGQHIARRLSGLDGDVGGVVFAAADHWDVNASGIDRSVDEGQRSVDGPAMRPVRVCAYSQLDIVGDVTVW